MLAALVGLPILAAADVEVNYTQALVISVSEGGGRTPRAGPATVEREPADSHAPGARPRRGGRDAERLLAAIGIGHPAPAAREPLFDLLTLVPETATGAMK